MVRVEQREALGSGSRPFGRALAGGEQTPAIECGQKPIQLDRDVSSEGMLLLKKSREHIHVCAAHQERQQLLTDVADSGG